MIRKKIPQDLLPEIMDKASQGMIGKEIKAWLKKEHDIDTSLSTVLRTLRMAREEKAEITKKIYADAAAETASDDIKTVNTLISNCFKDYEKMRGNRDMRMAMQIVDRLQRLIEFRAKYNGAFDNTVEVNIHQDISDLRHSIAVKLGVEEDE